MGSGAIIGPASHARETSKGGLKLQHVVCMVGLTLHGHHGYGEENLHHTLEPTLNCLAKGLDSSTADIAVAF